ncbi:alpha-amylase family glycosyl hydrolase [Pasteurella testudinis]|uniref:alpha-amylase family glycosyl hydrolase n=1 Tax=Pasteurella testudinis TaxID=761 RepID=UPI004059B520
MSTKMLALVLKILAQKSRDNSRTPMQWNSQPHAGFSSGEPWIGVAQNYQEINAESAVNDRGSVFYCYKKLIELRKSLPLLTDGNYQDLLPEHPSVWSYLRDNGKQKLWVLANLSGQTQTIARPTQTDGEWKSLLNNYPQALLPQDKIELAPYQAVYLLQA